MFQNLLTPSFIRQLDDAFYTEFPEEWQKGELFLDLPIFYSIWKGEANSHIRLRQEGEEVTTTCILRAGRKVWEADRVYTVRSNTKTEIDNKTTQTGEDTFTDIYTVESKGTVVGYLKLIEIRPDGRKLDQKEDELIFEKVDTPS